MSDDQPARVVHQPVDEGLEGRGGDDHAGGRAVALPRGEEGADHHLVDRPFQVGVLQDQGDALAAGLEQQRHLRAFEQQPPQEAGGGEGAGSEDGVHVGMRHHALTHHRTRALHEVGHPARQAAAVEQLEEHLPRGRRELAGLEDDGVSRQQGGPEELDRHLDGLVVGGRDGDHAPGDAVGAAQAVLEDHGGQQGDALVEELVQAPLGGPQLLGTLPGRLARLPVDPVGHRVGVVDELVAEAGEQRGALVQPGAAPARRSPSCAGHGVVHRGLGEGEAAEHVPAVRRVDAVDVAIHRLGLDEAAVDVVALPDRPVQVLTQPRTPRGAWPGL